MEHVAWVDGQLLPMSEATHTIFDNVTSYAGSVFEGIRAYDEWSAPDQPNGSRNVWLLTEHIRRLRLSAMAYRMQYPYTDAELVAATLELVRRNVDTTYIRPIVFRGDGLGVDPSRSPIRVAIGSFPWGQYVTKHFHNGGASVYVSNLTRPPSRFFPGYAKGAAGYAVWSQRAKDEANQAEASEALLHGEDDNGRRSIVDGSGMNLCLVEQGAIITPNPSRWNILHGLTMKFLLDEVGLDDLVAWQWGDITVDRLCRADEAFLLGTATEVTPVTLVKWQLPNKPIEHEVGSGQVGPVTTRLRQLLARAVHGLDDRYRSYLTPVPTAVPAES